MYNRPYYCTRREPDDDAKRHSVTTPDVRSYVSSYATPDAQSNGRPHPSTPEEHDDHDDNATMDVQQRQLDQLHEFDGPFRGLPKLHQRHHLASAASAGLPGPEDRSVP